MTRKIFFWLHLCVGSIAGIVILIMAFTGVLLTYEHQMIAYADREFRSVPSSPDAIKLPLESVLTKATQSLGKVPNTVVVRSRQDAPVELVMGRDVVYADAYTGTVLGEGSHGIREFFHKITDWHRWLGASTAVRPTLRTITGVANLIFLLLLLSGLYLWIPRVWKWQSVKAVAMFRGGLQGKARDFNWHNVIGVWMAVPLFFIIISGAVISFPWATSLVYTLTGTEPPPPVRVPAGGPGGKPRFDGFDLALASATKQVAGWQTMSVRLPTNQQAPFTFSIDESTRGRADKRTQMTIARQSGEVVKLENFAGFNTGRKVRGVLRFLHTGEFFGIPGQTLAGIASLGAVFLVYTGLALALRRFFAWRSRAGSGRVPDQVLAER